MSLALEWKGSSYQAEREERRDGRKEAYRARKSLERSRRMRLVFACFIAVAVFVSGLLIFSVYLHVAVVQNEMKARDVEHQIELERRHQEEVRVEIAGLESPARTEKIAAENQKMIQVAMAEYLETPAYQAARIEKSERLQDKDKEAMVSDAAQGNGAGSEGVQR